jgi:ABC-type transport system substrate-binding protein
MYLTSILPKHIMNKILCFLLFFSLLFLLISCKKREKKDLSGVFRYNESKGINTLDPAFARNQTIIWPVAQLYNGLVQMDKDLNIMPALAKYWEISEDGRIYTFTLRSDVYFHNNEAFDNNKGRLLSAFDVEYSFARILNPAIASPGLWIFNKLDQSNSDSPCGFKAINDTIFQIYLKEAFPPFLGILTMPYCYVVAREAIEQYGDNYGRNPVGTGPFQLKLWKQDEKLVMVKNPHYFEKDSNGVALPYLDAVSIRFIKDKQSEFLEFLAGNLDFLNSVHPSFKDELLTSSGKLSPAYSERLKILTQPYLNTEYLGFLVDANLNIVNESPLNDINIRKAINYGFDRVKMMKYLRNNVGKPALNGFIPYGLPGYNPQYIKGFRYNPDSTRYYLRKAGVPEGKGLKEIVLTTTSDYLDLCEFIQFELANFGIKINIEVATGGTFRNKVANSNLLFFRGSWLADYPDPENYLSLFVSENFSPQGPNYTHFSNSVYDSLYISSLKQDNFKAKIEIFAQMDQMLIDNAVIVPLYYDQIIRFIPIDLQGLISNPMNLLTLKYVKK